jgi:cytoskeletal protein RodZ
MALGSRLVETIVHTIGTKLRETREAQGIRIEEAANVTRIGKNYLIAMEDEAFDRLPSPAYVKGFLRVYAGFLGLSGDEIVALYEKSLPQPQPLHSLENEEEAPPSRRKISIPSPLYWSIPLLLLLALSSWLYSTGDRGRDAQNRAADSKSEPRAASPSFPARSSAAMGGDGVRLPADGVTGGPSSNPAPLRPAGIILKLKVNRDCWLNITIDDSVTQQYDLKTGDLIEWKGERVFALDLGNAAGVEAELNGRPLPPFGGEGKSVHVVLNDDGSGRY